MTLDPKVQSALDTITAALQGAPAAAPTEWWRPTADQLTAFCHATGSIAANVTGWTGTGNQLGAQSPIAPLALGDAQNSQMYASFGFRPNGVHYLWTAADLEAHRALADKIAAAPSPAAAEALCKGAGGPGVETDAVIYAIMTGLTNPLQDFSAPEFAAAGPNGPAQTLADVVWYLQRSGGSPSGG
jgi:hypothetical protein